MKMLISNEIYKFFKSKKNLILIGLFFLSSVLMITYNIQKSNGYMEMMSRGYSDMGRNSSKVATTLTNVLEEHGYIDGESREITLKRIDYLSKESNYLNSIGHFYSENNEKDFKYINTIKRDLFTSMIVASEEGVISINEVKRRGYTNRQLTQLAAYTQHLVDTDIQPLLNIYKIDGANGMVMSLKGINLIIFILVIALFSVDMYLREITEGSYKLSFTQPHERKSIFLSKVVVITGVSILLILLSGVLNFIVYTLIGGVGNWQYPMMAKESLMGLSINSLASDLLILPLWQYVFMGFLLLIPITFFTVMGILYISIATDGNSKTIGAILLLIFMAFVFSSFLPANSVINLWYPFSYLFTEKVIHVENRGNYGFGILINSIGATVFFVLSYLNFKKKDFLGAID